MDAVRPYSEEPRPVRLLVPSAAIEICLLFALLGLGVLMFELAWYSPEQAAVGTAIFLLCLDVLAWRHFQNGRHPCFLFLCVLTLLQAGRFLAYLFGNGSHPLRIAGVAPHSFDLTRSEAGTVLLSLSISALCVYSICRWNYAPIPPPSDSAVKRYLPYLYLVFYSTLPIQLYKNYSYYEFIKRHGGYLYLWIHHGDIVSSVPFVVRAVVLINAPAFLAIFVFERRNKWVTLATVCYFAATLFTLLVGFRSGVFTLVLVLWYVARVKSNKKTRLVALGALVLMLIVAASLVQTFREGGELDLSDYASLPLDFLRLQGGSIDVTSAAVKYEKLLSPYAFSYLWYDLQDSFVSRGLQDYIRGQRLPNDVTVVLNPIAFSRGRGTAGSYLAEMYLVGGLTGVFMLSLLLGWGFHLLYCGSRNAISLFVVASILPVIIIMPRGQLLDWGSELLKTGVSVAALWVGWLVYRTLI